MIPIQPEKDNDTIVTIKNSNIYKAGAKRILTLSLPHSTVYPCEVVLTLAWCTKSYSVTIQIETSLEVLSHGIKSICFLAFYIYKMKLGIFV